MFCKNKKKIFFFVCTTNTKTKTKKIKIENKKLTPNLTARKKWYRRALFYIKTYNVTVPPRRNTLFMYAEGDCVYLLLFNHEVSMLMFCHTSSSWSPCQIYACFTKIKKNIFFCSSLTPNFQVDRTVVQSVMVMRPCRREQFQTNRMLWWACVQFTLKFFLRVGVNTMSIGALDTHINKKCLLHKK